MVCDISPRTVIGFIDKKTKNVLMNTMNCVGGPYAGKRYAISHGSGFRVPTKLDACVNWSFAEEDQPLKAQARVGTYRG